MSRLSGSRINPQIVLACEKTSGTNGGTNATGAWATREVNVKSIDTASICSLASNEFTLPPGRYKARAASVLVSCDFFQFRFYNVTGAAALLLGPVCRVGSASSEANMGEVAGQFDLSVSSAVRLEYRASVAFAGAGLGFSSGWGTEVYTQIQMEKVR